MGELPSPSANSPREASDAGDVCEVCLDGRVYEGNEIMFCDKCNVAVHQGCYGVDKVPDDNWYCYPCAAGQDPATTVCELCAFSGGAYFRTKQGNWVHSLCVQWVPEVFVMDNGKKNPTVNTDYLDKKRLNLRCGLCKTKGACIQCSYGRCTSAVHPWCVIK
ncbi:PHD-zinc-finger like domain-containing protein, partial [Ochromonadaceae sp. CCMP2298]